MSTHAFSCAKCGTEISWQSGTPVSRRDTCPKCRADLRVCLNCRHYDAASRWECRESIQEAVREKDKANFCDAFQAHETPQGVSAASAADQQKEALRKAAEALFKKS